MTDISDQIATLTAERDEARAQRDDAKAYLKAFVYATIDPKDTRADVQVHQANPSLGWIFVLNDTRQRSREILGSQIRRAMEIVGFDKIKVDAPATTVADDHIAAERDLWRTLRELDAARADLAAALKREEGLMYVLTALVKLNDDSGPFGGELQFDRIERAWEHARSAIASKGE